jgi:hypothetical protein
MQSLIEGVICTEVVLSRTGSAMSDMYSLGHMIYSVFNRGQPLFDCKHSLSVFQSIPGALPRLSPHQLSSVPETLQAAV